MHTNLFLYTLFIYIYTYIVHYMQLIRVINNDIWKYFLKLSTLLILDQNLQQ